MKRPYSGEKLEGIAVLGDRPPEAATIDLLLTIDGQNDVPALAVLKNLAIPN
ncbi:hypothetical protein [Hoeflea sp. TYP-13]|uniref:hypothetical protein n=1 Tax=Hoeflea sp. TYP-13 TaxID=3230023 RepID=UPI0034C5D134